MHSSRSAPVRRNGANARIATSGNLTGKTFSDLADIDFDDPTFATASGITIEAVLLFIDTGVEATSRLEPTRIRA
jgi:hypothetical protein